MELPPKVRINGRARRNDALVQCAICFLHSATLHTKRTLALLYIAQVSTLFELLLVGT
jgi:hypothetical protein